VPSASRRRIEERDARALDIADVSRDEDEGALEGGGRQQAID
jgi:hypothetical protein